MFTGFHIVLNSNRAINIPTQFNRHIILNKVCSIFSLIHFFNWLTISSKNLFQIFSYETTFQTKCEIYSVLSLFSGESLGLRRNCGWEIALCTNCTTTRVMRPTGSVAFTSRHLFPVDLFTEETILEIVLVCIISRQNTFLVLQILTTFYGYNNTLCKVVGKKICKNINATFLCSEMITIFSRFTLCWKKTRHLDKNHWEIQGISWQKEVLLSTNVKL